MTPKHSSLKQQGFTVSQLLRVRNQEEVWLDLAQVSEEAAVSEDSAGVGRPVSKLTCVAAGWRLQFLPCRPLHRALQDMASPRASAQRQRECENNWNRSLVIYDPMSEVILPFLPCPLGYTDQLCYNMGRDQTKACIPGSRTHWGHCGCWLSRWHYHNRLAKSPTEANVCLCPEMMEGIVNLQQCDRYTLEDVSELRWKGLQWLLIQFAILLMTELWLA